jgi:hypothetical protein
MSLTAAEIVTLRNPVYGAKSDLATMISYAETQLSESAFCDQYNNAVALLTMHFYAKQNTGDAPGAVSSETEGRLSRSFDVSKGSDYNTDWATTKWGQELIQLALSCNFLPRNRMMPAAGESGTLYSGY